MTKKERADAVYKCLCDYMRGEGYKYQADEANRTVALQLTGADFPMLTTFKVEEEPERTFVYSKMPFEVQKERVVDMVMATTYVNQLLAIGTFCVDIENCVCSFESNESYVGLHGFNKEWAERVVMSAFAAIEKYNDKLYDVNRGYITVRDFASQVK